MGSVIAAGTSYATHGTPMIPVYVFYSMFGWQRTGDEMWALGDQLGRGFLLGATAGRTTLTGEGLQHNDGHSVLLASVSPACVAYDAAWAYELSYIVKDGLRRMYGPTEHPDGEDIFYYLTVYNEPYVQPAEPADYPGGPEALEQGVLRGLYRYARAAARRDAQGPGEHPRAQILASGVAHALGAGRAAAAGRGLGRGRRRVVGHVLDGAPPQRAVLRGVEHAAPGRGAAGALRHPGAGRPARPGGGGQRLDPGGPGPDRPLGAARRTARWAPTATGSPTPAPRPAGSSTWTRSRSRWPCSASWPAAAR